jgi:hypothetical protein
MRTLNRPMFRYGGPIKEGVMNGIREPKKNGGSMSKQFNTGLVGDERYPKTDGREHHVAFLAPLAFGAARMALRPLGQLAYRKALQSGLIRGTGLDKNLVRGGLGKFRTSTAADMTNKLNFTPNKVGKYFIDSPEGKFVRGAGGKASKFVAGAAKGLAKSPLGLGITAASLTDIFPGGKPFGPDKYLPNLLGQKFDKDGKKIPGTGIFNTAVEELTTETDTTPLTAEEKAALAKKKKAQAEAAKIAREKFAKAEKEKRYDNYRKIMDIEGMNKDAAYDSLIAASQAVTNEKDFKGSIKDGSLINKIIQSTSKQFDKPKATKKAIDSLILKGEIEKDIASAKPGTQYKAAADYASMQGVSIDQAYKDLGFSKVNNIATNLTAVNKSLGQSSTSSETLDQAIRLSQDGVIPKILADDTKMLELEKDPNFKDTITLFQETVKKNNLGPGVYIIGTEAFQIDEEGNQSQLY